MACHSLCYSTLLFYQWIHFRSDLQHKVLQISFVCNQDSSRLFAAPVMSVCKVIWKIAGREIDKFKTHRLVLNFAIIDGWRFRIFWHFSWDHKCVGNTFSTQKKCFFFAVCFHTATEVSINFIFEMNSVVHLPFFHLENVKRTKSWFMGGTVHWNIQQNETKAFWCAAQRMSVHLFLFVSDLSSSQDGWVFYDMKHIYLNNIKSVEFLRMSFLFPFQIYDILHYVFSEALYASNYTTFVFFRMPEVLLIFIDWLFFFFSSF